MAIQNSIIPAEKSQKYDSWQMPEVKDGQVVKTEKLQNRGPKGELVNVEKNEVIYNSLTAGQLEEISNQAYEDVREQAREDGYQQGYKDGTLQGISAGQKTIQTQSEALNNVIKQLHEFLGGQDDEVEQALVNLSVSVSQSVIRRELTIDSSHIKQVVKQAIEALPLEPKNITIFLCEQDHSLLKQHAETSEQWHLQVDPSLSPGGCRVTTNQSVVDYTLEEQFQQTVNSLVEGRFEQLLATTQSAEDVKPVD